MRILNVQIHILFIIQVGFKLFWDGRIPMISSLDGPDWFVANYGSWLPKFSYDPKRPSFWIDCRI
jgi:hypothetical protein